jgi:hypothetical protein
LSGKWSLGVIFFLNQFDLLYAQVNLVPNPSFEIFTVCPGFPGQVEYAFPWFNPTSDSPDYFNSCATVNVSVPYNFRGYQYANTGNAYMGCLFDDVGQMNKRDYIEVELTSSLISGQQYYCSLYVVLAVGGGYEGATNNIGICFTPDSLVDFSTIYVLNATPAYSHQSIITDTLNWVEISFFYTALGGEKFMTIGNFYPDTSNQTVNVLDPSDTVTDVNGYYYIDDVYLGEYIDTTDTNDINPEIEFVIFPNPSNGIFQINYDFNSPHEILVYDAIGRIVGQFNLNPSLNSLQIDFRNFSNGVYNYTVRDKNMVKVHMGKIVKTE